MKVTSRATVIAMVMSAVFGLATHSWAATITATSCSLSHVQAAVNAAVGGDKVVIPNGSCAWTSGINTTKQIKIEAQNYTPTKGGSMTRNVTITNNSTSDPLLVFTSGNNFHVGVAGIRFNEGSGNQNHVRFNGTGTKVPLVNDCAFQMKQRNGNEPDIAAIAFLSQGGVMWDAYISGRGFGRGGDPGPMPGSAGILVNSPRPWTSASTMGSADTNGTINVYIEDSTFDVAGDTDMDDNARLVIRHSYLNGSVILTHGFTSRWGGRHWEIYNNTFSVTDALRNHAGRYFWARAGTGIFTDNVVNNASAPVNYGTVDLLQIGDNTSPKGSYLVPRQPGSGHNGASYVSDPIYVWNNTGSRAYEWGFQNAPGGWQGVVVQNRDIFVNGGPKPGYSKYTYPHPFRTGSSASLPAPTNLRTIQ